MSELLSTLEGFIKELHVLKNLMLKPFSRNEVVTEDFGDVAITKENFSGMPGLITQLNEDGVYKVRDLPKELLILGNIKG